MDGTSLPPFLIYESATGNIQDTWVEDFNPEKEKGYFAASPTGWTNNNLSIEWLEQCFDPCTKAKARNRRDYRLLLLDGHGNHINMKFLDWCEKHRIIVAVLPPHSIYRLQPLDISLFNALSIAYTKELVQWQAKTQGLSRLSKREFWDLFYPAFQASFIEKNIISGWEKCGLHPFNPDIIISQLERPPSSSSSSSASSAALESPTARDLRRLFEKISLQDPKASISRKLQNTLEKLQTENELLKHENKGLRETIHVEKKRRKRGKPLRDYLFDRDDPNAAQVFSPSKIQLARQRKAEMEAQQEEEALQKQLEKEQKKRAAEERKAQVEERKRQRAEEKQLRDEAKRQKQLELEEKRAQRLVEKQLRTDTKLQARQKKTGITKATGRKTSSISPQEVQLLPKNQQQQQSDPSKKGIQEISKGQKSSLIVGTNTIDMSLAPEVDGESVEVGLGSSRPKRNTQPPRRYQD